MKEILKNNSKKIVLFGVVFVLVIFITILLIKMNKPIKDDIVNKDDQEEKIVQSNERDETRKQIKVITLYINIRKNKDVTSDILGQVHMGEVYTIISEDEGNTFKWIEIETNNNIHGYISGISDYVERLSVISENENGSEKPSTPTKPSGNKTNSNNNTSSSNNTNNTNNKNQVENVNKPNQIEKTDEEAKKCEKTCDTGYTLKNSDSSECYCEKNQTETKEDNVEKEKLKAEYLSEVEKENKRFEEEKAKAEEDYFNYSIEAKVNMADQEYFASLFGGLYYGTERDYKREYENLKKNNEYDKASKLTSRWHHTQEYRKWEKYLAGLPEEKRLYLKTLSDKHEKNLDNLKQKYNQ